MTNNNSKGKSHVGEIVGVAAGVVVAAAAATYFLYGSKNAKKYRGKLKSWMFKAKAEILERLEKLEHVSEGEYNTIVDAVLSKYKNVKDMNMDDMKRFMVDIKKQWKAIKKHIGSTRKSGGKKKK